MKQVTIAIGRGKVMGVVEGISVIISQKNGGTPSFEQLWASEDERAKLDIYYREAVSDLERRLMEWLSSSSSQYDLEAEGTDYTLKLRMHQYWPARLEGLLKNKVQDYLVHSITAGWLNDFDGVTTKQDYSEMAGNDLADIREIVMQKEFGFGEGKRGDDASKETPESVTPTGERGDDASKEMPESVIPTGERGADTDKPDAETATEAGRRRSDQHKSNSGDGDVSTKQRRSDGEHKNGEWRPGTHRRREDDETFADEEQSFEAGARHEDNARVCHERDWTDWSGTHIDPCWPRHHHHGKGGHGW